MDAHLINPARILITPAQVPDKWPPSRERAAQVLLELYSQHLVARRDWVMRRAQETVVERQPYAGGRVVSTSAPLPRSTNSGSARQRGSAGGGGGRGCGVCR